MRVPVRPLLSLLVVALLGACERVTAPEARAAAETLERLGERGRWANDYYEYDLGMSAATGVLRRLEGSASRIVVERDGRVESFNAIVWENDFEGTAAAGRDESGAVRILVAWQSPGVRNVVYLETASEPVPFEKLWVDDTTSFEAFEKWHARVPFARQAYIFGESRLWRASGGVATIGRAGPVVARCADGLRSEDTLDDFSKFLSAKAEGGYVPAEYTCDVVSYPVAIDAELFTYRRDVSPDTLRYQMYDRRIVDPRPVRLVAPPQVVHGVRFKLRCDDSTPQVLRPRCPEGTNFAPGPRP